MTVYEPRAKRLRHCPLLAAARLRRCWGETTPRSLDQARDEARCAVHSALCPRLAEHKFTPTPFEPIPIEVGS